MNYRSLCLLDAMKNLMKGLIMSKLLPEIEINHGILNRQYGITKGRFMAVNRVNRSKQGVLQTQRSVPAAYVTPFLVTKCKKRIAQMF